MWIVYQCYTSMPSSQYTYIHRQLVTFDMHQHSCVTLELMYTAKIAILSLVYEDKH